MEFNSSLTDRQRKVVVFIRGNPGLTKNKLRVMLPNKGVGSSVTVNKDLNELSRLGLIKFRHEKGKAKNSPIKCYINEDNELTRLDATLDILQESFTKLTLKILRRYFEVWPPVSDDAAIAIKVRNQLIALLNQAMYFF